MKPNPQLKSYNLSELKVKYHRMKRFFLFFSVAALLVGAACLWASFHISGEKTYRFLVAIGCGLITVPISLGVLILRSLGKEIRYRIKEPS